MLVSDVCLHTPAKWRVKPYYISLGWLAYIKEILKIGVEVSAFKGFFISWNSTLEGFVGGEL